MNNYGLGVPWLWQLPSNHPFHEAAIKHDIAYDDRRSGRLSDTTSHRVDRLFLEDCLKIAGNNWKLKSQAYLFYYICRVWGAIYW